MVPRTHLLLPGRRRLFRGAAVELRRVARRRHRRARRVRRIREERRRTPAPLRRGVILRRTRLQPRRHGVDRRAVARGRGAPAPQRAGGRPLVSKRERRSADGARRTRDSERMSVPLSQMWTVATYVLGQRLRGRRRYPLVLMLEPLFRCNLACAGCGKIQYPAQILRKHLTVDECLRAVDECGAPIVPIPGGEPLMYPEIDKLVVELVKCRKYIYLCTNAILLKEKLDLFTPSKYLTFSVHMDGLREEHDEPVCRDGVFDEAVDGIKEALRRGFRVTTNTTLFDGTSPLRTREF